MKLDALLFQHKVIGFMDREVDRFIPSHCSLFRRFICELPTVSSSCLEFGGLLTEKQNTKDPPVLYPCGLNVQCPSNVMTVFFVYSEHLRD